MNCQPSFRTGSVPVVGPSLDGLRAPPRRPPPRRVPDCDIVDVGSSRPAARPDDPVDVRDLAFAAGRNAAGRTERRNYTKALLALLILQVAVAGGLHLRKRLAEGQVIVVPATVDERSVIT